MARALEIPNTIDALHAKAGTPYQMGEACGVLAEMITILVKINLDHSAGYRSNRVVECIDAREFTAAVDASLKEMRSKDGVTMPFPDALSNIDRKERRYRRRYSDRYIEHIKGRFAKAIHDGLYDTLKGFGPDANQQFNKGFDYGHNRMAWRAYPSVNVVLEAKQEDWSIWLRARCESLGLISLRNDLPVFDP